MNGQRQYLDEFEYDNNDLEKTTFEGIKNVIMESMLKEEINSDFQRAFVYFLGEDIKDVNNDFIKDGFSTVRYNILFTTPKIESELMDNNLQNKEDLYFVFPMTASILRLDYNKYRYIQKSEAITFCIEAMEKIIDLESGLEASMFKDLNMALFSTYYRAGLSLIYNHKNYKKCINEIIEDTAVNNDNNHVCNKIIDDVVLKVKSDISKCKYLTLYKEK